MPNQRLNHQIRLALSAIVGLLVLMLTLTYVEVADTEHALHLTTHFGMSGVLLKHLVDLMVYCTITALVIWIVKLRKFSEHQRQTEVSELKLISAEKQTSLQAAHHQISDILKASPDLVWAKDTHGIYTSCNLAFAQYIGFTVPQIIGKTDFELAPTEQAQAFREHDRQTISKGITTRVEEKHIPANGNEPRLFEIIKTPSFDEQGHTTGVHCIGRDITDARLATEALTQANTRNRLLAQCIAQTEEAIIITEAAPVESDWPRIVFVNTAFARMTGYPTQETLGQPLSMLHGSKTQPEVLQRIRQAMNGWLPVLVELIQYNKEGNEFWAELSMSPVPAENGAFTHWIAVQRDITARKLAESETLHLLERANEGSKLKSEFLAAINHEMRTPMNGVIGLSNLLLTTTLDDQQTMYATYILNSAQDYMAVINRALDFSMLDAGNLLIASRVLALAPLLQDLEQSTLKRAKAKGLTMHWTVPSNLPDNFYGDELRLRQCLAHLLDNAVKFTAKGEIGLVVSLVTSEGRQHIRYEVTDTGTGLSDIARNRLFQPFVQGDGSATRSHGGIGLGLVIVQQLVLLMQGELKFESMSGKGSTFWFDIPLRSA